MNSLPLSTWMARIAEGHAAMTDNWADSPPGLGLS
jgi:hypothetical protein